MLEDLEALLRASAREGIVRMEYETKIYVGSVEAAPDGSDARRESERPAAPGGFRG